VVAVLNALLLFLTFCPPRPELLEARKFLTAN
jgi:hypothetical protein